jgi:hypothetical protein
MVAESGVKDPWILGATTRHLDWRRQTEVRYRARAVWREYFKSFDAFLLPVNFVPAFPQPDFVRRRSRRHYEMDKVGRIFICSGTRPARSNRSAPTAPISYLSGLTTSWTHS